MLSEQILHFAHIVILLRRDLENVSLRVTEFARIVKIGIKFEIRFGCRTDYLPARIKLVPILRKPS